MNRLLVTTLTVVTTAITVQYLSTGNEWQWMAMVCIVFHIDPSLTHLVVRSWIASTTWLVTETWSSPRLGDRTEFLQLGLA